MLDSNPLPGDVSLFTLVEATMWSFAFIQSTIPNKCMNKNLTTTSMHSSRMRTTRLLPISPSMHCAWGGVCYTGGVCYPGDVCYLGVSATGARCLLTGGCLLLRGMSAFWGVYPSMHWGRHTPLWTEWLTDRCKNITFTNFVCRW